MGQLFSAIWYEQGFRIRTRIQLWSLHPDPDQKYAAIVLGRLCTEVRDQGFEEKKSNFSKYKLANIL